MSWPFRERGRLGRPANDNYRPKAFAEGEGSWRIGGILLIALMAAYALVMVRASFADAVISGPAKVINGDTFEVGVVRIHLHGIDAPEEGQKCGRGTSPCGTAATSRMAELVDGQEATKPKHRPPAGDRSGGDEP